jgi:uncharacterized RDD family membrane protein YckC
VDRGDVGSWLSGPRSAPSAAESDLGYAGQRLGLAEHGPGSVTGWGRRLLAIFVDWVASMLVAKLIYPGEALGQGGYGWVVLLIFVVETTLFIWTIGASFGQRLVGLRVVSVTPDGLSERTGLGRAALRQVLVGLLIPAVIYNRDRRGLQDLAARTVVVIGPGRPTRSASSGS